MRCLKGLPNDRHNPGRRSRVLQPRIGGRQEVGRRRGAAAENGLGTKALRGRVSFSLRVGLERRRWVYES